MRHAFGCENQYTGWSQSSSRTCCLGAVRASLLASSEAVLVEVRCQGLSPAAGVCGRPVQVCEAVPLYTTASRSHAGHSHGRCVGPA